MSDIVLHPNRIYEILNSGDYGKSIKSAYYKKLGGFGSEKFSFTIDMDIANTQTDSVWETYFEQKNNAKIFRISQVQINGQSSAVYKQVFFYMDINLSLPVAAETYNNACHGKLTDSVFPNQTFNMQILNTTTDSSNVGLGIIQDGVNNFINAYLTKYPSGTTLLGNELLFAVEAVSDNMIRMFGCVYSHAVASGSITRRTKVEAELTVENNSISVYQPSKISPTYEVKGQHISLCAKNSSGTKYAQEMLSEDIVANYKNGIETAEIRCEIAEYKDTEDNVVISTKDTTKSFAFNIGDTVVPYKQAPNGEVPLSINLDGTAKRFYVYGVQFVYDGGLSQIISLRNCKTT